MKDDDYTTKNDPCQLFISKSHREPVRLWFLQHTRPRCLPSQGAHFTRFEKKLHILNDFRVTLHCPRLHFRDQTPVTFTTSHGIQGMTAHVNCLDIKKGNACHPSIPPCRALNVIDLHAHLEGREALITIQIKRIVPTPHLMENLPAKPRLELIEPMHRMGRIGRWCNTEKIIFTA